jgi:lipopolysaccharide/colanic/teichoic acid biosynthesis glycosyltransferase
MQQLTAQQLTIRQEYTDDALYIANVGSESALYYYGKHLFDLLIILLVVTLLLPLLLLISLLIKLDSPGPVLFVQERVGAKRIVRQGKIFWAVRNFHIYKFRSMFYGVDQSVHQAHIQAFVRGELDDTTEVGVKLTNDQRITRVGHFLRKTSLDELPQLLNILKGEMNLVGPRPVPVYEVAEYKPQHYLRLAAVPGITGLWQVKGRGEVSFEEMMELDSEYVRNKSFWLDLKIMVLTAAVVLSGRGAK